MAYGWYVVTASLSLGNDLRDQFLNTTSVYITKIPFLINNSRYVRNPICPKHASRKLIRMPHFCFKPESKYYCCFTNQKALLAIIAKLSFPICWMCFVVSSIVGGVYEQNSIANKYLCRWLDSKREIIANNEVPADILILVFSRWETGKHQNSFCLLTLVG